LVDPVDLRSDFEEVINEWGTVITLTKHLLTYSGLYNEALYQAGSNTTTSGLALFQPIGASDVQILPQGQVTLYPRIMFVHGSVDLTADSFIVDATGSRYEVIPGMGVYDHVVSGTIIYRKAFVRAQIGSEYEYAGQ
jgi:hypothetical protein